MDAQELGAFLNESKENLHVDVQVQLPLDLKKAIGLAKVFDSMSSKKPNLWVEGPTQIQ